MTTQFLKPDVDEALDLSALDALDDQTKHLFCVGCTPPGAGLFKAACGKWARCLGIPLFTPPRDACPECTEMFKGPCKSCGLGG